MKRRIAFLTVIILLAGACSRPTHKEADTATTADVQNDTRSDVTTDVGADATTADTAADTADVTSEDATDVTSDLTSEDATDVTSEDATDVTSDLTSEDATDVTSEDATDVTSDLTSEDATDVTSEDAGDDASADTTDTSTFCVPNSKLCSGNTLRVCKSDGSSYDDTDCQLGCVPSTLACATTCTPGTTKCQGDALLTCNVTGSDYDSQGCTNGCNSNNNACNSTCRPGDKACDNGEIATCNGNGDGYDRTPCTYGCDQSTTSCFSELTAAAGDDQEIMVGDEITLSAMGTGGDQSSLSCVWSDGTSTVSTSCSFKVSPTANTVYTVEITDGSGNKANDQLSVTVNPALAADAGSDQKLVLGEQVTLTAGISGGVGTSTCAWLVNDSPVSTNCEYSFIPQASLTLVLKVTDSKDHSTSDSVYVEVFPVLTVDAGSDAQVPVGVSATLSATIGGGVPAITCAWTDANNAPVSSNCSGVNVSPTQTTTYKVTVTDAKGHTASDTVTVTTVALQASAGVDQFINKGSTTLTGTVVSGVQPISCAWYRADDGTQQNELSNNQCSFQLNVDETTEFKLVMTDSANNTSTDTVVVNVLAVTATANKANILSGQSSELGVNVSGNKGTPTCVWKDDTDAQIATDCTTSVAPTVNTIYTVTITDPDTGLSASHGVQVRVYPVLSVGAGDPRDILSGNSTTLNAVVTGGVPAVGCVWNDGTSDFSTSCSGVEVSPTSTTSYTVTATDSEGNKTTDSVTISVYAALSVGVSTADQVLPGQSADLTGNVTGGLPSVTCSWTNSGVEISTSCTTVQVSPSDTTTYTFSATDATPETKSATVQISVFRADAGNDVSIYKGSSTKLSAATSGALGSLSYLWKDGTGNTVSTNQEVDVSPTATTTYTLSVTDSFKGLVASDTVTVNVADPLSVNAGNDDQILSGASATLSSTVSGGYAPVTCEWTAGGPPLSTSCTTLQVTPSDTTTYTLTASDAKNGSGNDTVTVFVLKADAGQDRTIDAGQSTTLKGSATGTVGNLSYLWKDENGNTVSSAQDVDVSPATTTTYTLSVTDDFKNLVATATVKVSVESCSDGVKNGTESDKDCGGGTVWINEIHYDNSGSDTEEGVEIAGPTGSDLTGWKLIFYNGSGGVVYDTLTLSGTIGVGSRGIGFKWFARAGIQNGDPDGIALVNKAGNVIQFLSYGGSFTATDGPAKGMASTNIGVKEPTSTTVGHSLQLTGSGTKYSDFTWQPPSPSSHDALNPGQTITARFCPPCGVGGLCNVDSDCDLNFCLNGSCSTCEYTVSFDTISTGNKGTSVEIDRITFSANEYVAVLDPATPFTAFSSRFLLLLTTLSGGGSAQITFPFPVNKLSFLIGDQDFEGRVVITTNSTSDPLAELPYGKWEQTFSFTYPAGQTSRSITLTPKWTPPDAVSIDDLKITGPATCLGP